MDKKDYKDYLHHRTNTDADIAIRKRVADKSKKEVLDLFLNNNVNILIDDHIESDEDKYRTFSAVAEFKGETKLLAPLNLSKLIKKESISSGNYEYRDDLYYKEYESINILYKDDEDNKLHRSTRSISDPPIEFTGTDNQSIINDCIKHNKRKDDFMNPMEETKIARIYFKDEYVELDDNGGYIVKQYD